MESKKPDEAKESKSGASFEAEAFERVLKNLESLAKKHEVIVSLSLDGKEVAEAKLEPKNGINAGVRIKDYRKLLFSLDLIKTALSFMALLRKFRKFRELRELRGLRKIKSSGKLKNSAAAGAIAGSDSGAGEPPREFSVTLESGFIRRLFSGETGE